MEKVKLEKVISDIAAIRPTYIEDVGKTCEIYLKDGSVLTDSRDPNKLAREMAGILAVDLGSLRRFSNHRLGIRNAVPLPLSPNLLLVPLRMRKPMVDGDTATGFVNYFCVDDVSENEETGTIIKLETGSSITCLQKKRTVDNHMIKARLIYKEWKSAYLNPYVKEVEEDLYKSAKIDLIREIIR